MFQCNICKLDIASVKIYVEHCRVHSNLPKVRLPCCYRNCAKTTTTYNALRRHIGREHGKIRSSRTVAKLQGTDSNLKCSLISCTFQCNEIVNLVKHLKQHICDGMCVDCPIYGCKKKYAVKSSFTCHLTRDHAQWAIARLKDEIYSDNMPVCATENEELGISQVQYHEDGHSDLEDNTESQIFEIHHPVVVSSKQDFIKNLSLFFLKLSAHHLIPDTTVEIVANEIRDLNALNYSLLKQTVRESLNKHGVVESVSQSVIDDMNEHDLISQCLEDRGLLQGTSRRLTFVKQNLTYVQPQSVYLGVDSRNKSRYAYYVPIKESLAALLKDSSVLQQCVSHPVRRDGVLLDFTDGSVYKSKCDRDGTKNLLSLILYQDSFEVVNPLGSAKKKHKILAFYFSLGNLAPHNRSCIDHVQLLLLALECDVNRVGHRMFNRLVNDLLDLEKDGIDLLGNRFFVNVAAIAGDNLGSHWIGGFVTNFSSTMNICRFCTLTKIQLHEGLVVADDCQIRSPASYDLALTKLSVSDERFIDGIKFNSVFNRLKTFHVCDPGLPPCVAHDLFEGVVSYDMALFIQYFARDKQKHKLFTVQRLNAKLEGFGLSGSDANVKPPSVSLNPERLSGSASQNWCFLRIFPLLICGLVDPVDDVFETVMLLRNIVEFVMAPAIAVGQVAYMRILIEDYLERRQTLFPQVPLRPKHHFMSHYPMLTLEFGPLIRLWTMRFEHKHQYFKRCMRYSRNFVNVTKMLASRHQLQQAYLAADLRFKSDTVISDSVRVCELVLSQDIRNLMTNLGLMTAQACCDVAVNGTVYSKGLFLPLNVQPANRGMVFGELLFFVVGPEVQCVINVWQSSYSFILGGYVLFERNGVQCVPLTGFADFYPLCKFSAQGQFVVILKHQPLDVKVQEEIEPSVCH